MVLVISAFPLRKAAAGAPDEYVPTHMSTVHAKIAAITNTVDARTRQRLRHHRVAETAKLAGIILGRGRDREGAKKTPSLLADSSAQLIYVILTLQETSRTGTTSNVAQDSRCADDTYRLPLLLFQLRCAVPYG